MLAGPLAACALLLAIAGVAKAYRPLPTVRALRSAALPGNVTLVRLLGAGEAVLAVVALFVAGPLPAALIALSYAAFAGFVIYARARGGTVSSCGCFASPIPRRRWLTSSSTSVPLSSRPPPQPGQRAHPCTKWLIASEVFRSPY